MDNAKLAQLLYPNVKHDVEYYLKKYPKRNLKEGEEVTRLAPSPTGYLHIGHLYSALIDRLTAKNGVFYVRLEDTDQKREIKNAGTIACQMLKTFGIKIDEGYLGDNEPEIGEYGPYVQSKRLEIYNAFAKELVLRGRAFPCFCEKSESKQDVLERREQELENSDGIESKDPCRNLTLEEIENNLKQGKKFALRLKSSGDINKGFKFVDRIKGEREVKQNNKDIVLVKSNGIPPYSLAHIVDDTLMGTTTVVRGEEWYPSLSAHLEIFDAIGLKPPKYAHTPVICKLDGGNKRKLSKRKDPEADVRYYLNEGYPINTVIEYLLTLLNSNFEDWRRQNPKADLSEFNFSISKIGSNNPMFDFNKLNDISKTVICYMTAEEIYSQALNWASANNAKFYEIMKNNKQYLIDILNIDRNTAKPRKDIAKWSEIPTYYNYMFDEYFEQNIGEYEFDANVSAQNIKKVLQSYLEVYCEDDDKETWFAKIKQICEPLGFCADMKKFKQDPNAYFGSVATVSGIIRVATTKKANTPDLYYILKLLGKEKIKQRFDFVIKNLK